MAISRSAGEWNTLHLSSLVFVLSFAHFPPYGLEFFREGPKKKMQMPGECQTVALALEVFSWQLIKMQRLRFDGHKVPLGTAIYGRCTCDNS